MAKRFRLFKLSAVLLGISVLLSLLSIQPLSVISYILTSLSEAPTITLKDLKQLPADSFVLVDAREPKEYAVSHLPGALFGGYKNFDVKSLPMKDLQDKTVVVYCSVGYRSAEVVNLLRESEVNAVNLKGGIFQWSRQGQPLLDDQGRATRKVHGYEKPWSYLLDNENVILN